MHEALGKSAPSLLRAAIEQRRIGDSGSRRKRAHFAATSR